MGTPQHKGHRMRNTVWGLGLACALILCCLFVSIAQAGVLDPTLILEEETTSLGPITTLKCTGGNSTCSRNGSVGTITTTVGSAPPADVYVKGHMMPLEWQQRPFANTASSGWQSSGCPLGRSTCMEYDGDDDYATIWTIPAVFDFASTESISWDGWVYITDSVPVTINDRVILDRRIQADSGSVDQFDDETADWTGNQITVTETMTPGANEDRFGTINLTTTATSATYFYKDVTDFSSTLNTFRIRYKSHTNGPTGIAIYYTEGSVCPTPNTFSASCVQTFSNTMIADGAWHTLEVTMTDANWPGKTISSLRINLLGQTATGTVNMDWIVVDRSDPVYRLEIPVGTDELRFSYRNSADTTTHIWTSTDLNITAGAWYYIGFKYTFGTGSSFVAKKGTGATLSTLTGSWTTGTGNDAPLAAASQEYITYLGGQPGKAWKGLIADVSLWRSLLADTGSPSFTERFNGGSGTACSTSMTGIAGCWPINEGAGNLGLQLVAPSGVGSDAADGLSSSTAKRTIAAAKALAPSAFLGNMNIHVATGVYPEQLSLEDFRPDGPYTMLVEGYLNCAPNSFTDAAFKTGTSAGSNTNVWPKTARTQFIGAANSFGFDDEGSVLKLTGGTGFISETGGYVAGNWYPIECGMQPSGVCLTTNMNAYTTASVAARWGAATPDNTTTYAVFRPDCVTRLHGKQTISPVIQVINSSGVSLRKLAWGYDADVTGTADDALLIRNSSIKDISTVFTPHAMAYGIDAQGSVIDNLETVIAIEPANDTPRFIYGSFASNISKVMTLRAGNWLTWGSSCSICGGGGLAFYFGGSSNNIKDILGKNSQHAGFTLELSAQTVQLNRYRGENNKHCLVIGTTAGAHSQYPWVCRGNGNGAVLQIGGIWNAVENASAEPVSDYAFENNDLAILMNDGGICRSCSKVTFSGNTASSCSNCTNVTLANGANDNIQVSGVGSGARAQVRVTGPTGAFNITGFCGPGGIPPLDGDEIILHNAVAQAMTMTNEGATSTAVNRIFTLNTTVTTGTGMVHLRYSGVDSRWIIVAYQP